jgi:hypothetical protein
MNKATTPAMVGLMIAMGCSSLPPADLSGTEFAPVRAVHVFSGPILISVDPGAVRQRVYGSGSANYGWQYQFGDVERRYAQAVANAVFANPSFTARASDRIPEMRLTSFSHTLITHSSGSMPDVTDEATAHWTLFDANGIERARFVFVGHHSAATGLGGREAHRAMAQKRGRAALVDLYNNSVARLAAGSEFARLKLD